MTFEFRRWAVAATTLLALLAFEFSAAAYCRLTTCDSGAGEKCARNERNCISDGVALVWASSPIVYRFQRNGSEAIDTTAARAVIRRAFEQWSTVECERGRTSLRFEEGPQIRKDKPLGEKEGTEAFGIYFRDAEWPHEDTGESLALTNHIYGKRTGRIDYADIEVNTAKTTFALTDEEKGTDFQAVMTHEAGHYIGLAHSNDADSIMVASYCQSEGRCKNGIDRARSLSEDDILAVCTLYPPGKSTPSPPAAGCAAGGPRGDLGLGLGVAAFVVAVVRRRRALS